MITLTQESGSVAGKRNLRDNALAEQYYSLAHWLRPIGDMSAVGPKTIGITSCTRGVGTSTVASNLAIVAAQARDQPVLLIDLSTARSTLATRFSMLGDLGLRDALADVARPGECVKATPITNLSVLAVNETGDPRALKVDCGRLNNLLQALEREFGFIVVDLPSIESSLCFATAGLLNGVLIVMEAERTRFEAAARAKQRLIHAQANVLGVILNKYRQYIPNWLDAGLC